MSKTRIFLALLYAFLLAGIPGMKASAAYAESLSSYGIIDIDEMESGLKKIQKAVESLSVDVPRGRIAVTKDPFSSLMPVVREVPSVEAPMPVESEQAEEKQEEKVPSRPSLNITGIVYGSQPMAVIESEVIGEGEYAGRYLVYRIESDRVLLKYGNTVFQFPVGR